MCYNFSTSYGGDFVAEILKMLVQIMARIHNYIIRCCILIFGSVSDKWLHFWVIGVLGMLMIAVVYPLFKLLAQKKMIMIISWIYVFTMLVVITFAIEIGQKITNTGNMEFADIAAGLAGFSVMFAVMMALWGCVLLIKKTLNKTK